MYARNIGLSNTLHWNRVSKLAQTTKTKPLHLCGSFSETSQKVQIPEIADISLDTHHVSDRVGTKHVGPEHAMVFVNIHTSHTPNAARSTFELNDLMV